MHIQRSLLCKLQKKNTGDARRAENQEGRHQACTGVLHQCNNMLNKKMRPQLQGAREFWKGGGRRRRQGSGRGRDREPTVGDAPSGT